MSRSWTERAAAGIAIGRDYVAAAELAGRRVRAAREARLAAPLFLGKPAPGAGSMLERALREVAAPLARRYLPLHVSVPDALVRWSVFELDELPRESAAQLELAAFRFSRRGLNGGHAYACQPLGEDRGKKLLFAMAGDAAWLELVAGALKSAGLGAWSVNGNACRQFNAFHDQLAGESGALVAAAPDAWSLLVWDAQGRPRYARGHWRTHDDFGAIALEVERAIVAYVEGDAARSVQRVYVCAGDDTPALQRALDERLREPCKPLLHQPAAPGAAALAVAAALEQ